MQTLVFEVSKLGHPRPRLTDIGPKLAAPIDSSYRFVGYYVDFIAGPGQETMLLQAATLGEICAGIGTMSLASEILSDNVYAVLQQCMPLSSVFAVALGSVLWGL